MKRVIFSIFNDNVDQNHKSTNDYKLNQFRTYSTQLTECKEKYAQKCGAEFILHLTDQTDYNTIQFDKILWLEKYSETYDEILYLDFDVVPTDFAPNIFDEFDTNKICIHPLRRDLSHAKINEGLKDGWLDNQNVFTKTAAKKSMLLIEDIIGNDHLYNTGVVLGNSKIIKSLRFGERLQELHDLLDEAKDDSLYPDEVTRNFYYNNEVYISYLIELEKIPHIDLSMAWNFILDGYQPDPTDAGYFIHHVNKEFEKSFG